MSFKSELKKRTYVSILAIIIVAFFVYFSSIWVFKPILTIVISLVTAMALYEYAKLNKQQIFIPLLIGVGIAEIISFSFLAFFSDMFLTPIFILFIYLLILFLNNMSSISGSIARISTSLFGLIYIAMPLGMLLPILYFANEDGRLWVFYLILVTKVNDIAAYFGGKLFGKKKLSKVSPNKTIEGSIIGLIFSVIISVIFSYCTKAWCYSYFQLDLLPSIILGVLLGIVGQIGDLCESLIKRDAKIKDSNAIPGLGGILDMIDSLIFNIPIIFFYLLR